MSGVRLPPPRDLEQQAVELLRLWRVPDTGVRVRWNARLRTSAGRAFVQSGRVELNPHLLEQSPGQLRTVLVHEVAHVAAARLFGAHQPAHGRHWRGLMRLAGETPSITHDMPVPRRRRRRYLYLRVCDGCGDRRIGDAVRYAACACGARDRFLVLRAPAGPGGRAALQRVSLSEARRRCMMAGA